MSIVEQLDETPEWERFNSRQSREQARTLNLNLKNTNYNATSNWFTHVDYGGVVVVLIERDTQEQRAAVFFRTLKYYKIEMLVSFLENEEGVDNDDYTMVDARDYAKLAVLRRTNRVTFFLGADFQTELMYSTNVYLEQHAKDKVHLDLVESITNAIDELTLGDKIRIANDEYVWRKCTDSTITGSLWLIPKQNTEDVEVYYVFPSTEHFNTLNVKGETFARAIRTALGFDDRQIDEVKTRGAEPLNLFVVYAGEFRSIVPDVAIDDLDNIDWDNLAERSSVEINSPTHNIDVIYNIRRVYDNTILKLKRINTFMEMVGSRVEGRIDNATRQKIFDSIF